MARAKPSAPESAPLTFTALIEPADEGGYVVTFPAIPDLATQGETVEEARLLAEDCLRGYLEVLRETGRSLPAPGTAAPSAHATRIPPGEPPASDAQAPAGDPGVGAGGFVVVDVTTLPVRGRGRCDRHRSAQATT